MHKSIFISVVIILILVSLEAFSFYCNDRIIDEKDLMTEVLAKCGDPDGRSNWTKARHRAITQIVPVQYGLPVIRQDSLVAYDEYEQWVYNFGPHRLIQVLTFKNGILTRIKNGGYGH